VKIGPYRVKRKLDNDNYELDLPERMRIHPIFHISLLSKTDNPVSDHDEGIINEYEVERILQKRVRKGKTQYLVKWKGYDYSENTWEPTEHLHCPEKVAEFNQSLKSKNREDN
jgi:chromodomain-containing protein